MQRPNMICFTTMEGRIDLCKANMSLDEYKTKFPEGRYAMVVLDLQDLNNYNLVTQYLAGNAVPNVLSVMETSSPVQPQQHVEVPLPQQQQQQPSQDKNSDILPYDPKCDPKLISDSQAIVSRQQVDFKVSDPQQLQQQTSQLPTIITTSIKEVHYGQQQEQQPIKPEQVEQQHPTKINNDHEPQQIVVAAVTNEVEKKTISSPQLSTSSSSSSSSSIVIPKKGINLLPMNDEECTYCVMKPGYRSHTFGKCQARGLPCDYFNKEAGCRWGEQCQRQHKCQNCTSFDHPSYECKEAEFEYCPNFDGDKNYCPNLMPDHDIWGFYCQLGHHICRVCYDASIDKPERVYKTHSRKNCYTTD